MNNKRSPFEQLLLVALLTFSAFTLWNQFYGPKKPATVAARPTPALSKAFDGFDPATQKLPTVAAATAQIAGLQKQIEANGKDDYAMWAHLRIGLLQQFVLRNSIQARESYDFVINRRKNEPIDAQALYQKGDLMWREATLGKTDGQSTPAASTPATANATTGNSATDNSATGNAVTSTPATTPASNTTLNATQIAALKTDAVHALEQIPIRGRGHQAFLDSKIFVPDADSHREGNPLDLPRKWEQLTLTQLRGEAQTPGTRGILSRVDEYYKPTPLYKIFDTVVKWYGQQPLYSYGLALITLAMVTRIVMQPLIKKQYDSMKGMAIIAPEMKKIQDKYKGKSDQPSQVKMMQEIRALQKTHGVNPMGCGLSMIIQMPVFFFFVLPLINHYQARMELDHASFGWIQSLARPDIPLLVFYAISMFISVRLSATPPADEQQKQMQKMTTLMSPLFALFLWSYPSAFIMYWITYNVLSMIFQWRMIKKSDPNKDLVKTLMGTAPEGAVLASATAAALPSRPNNGKNSGKKTEVVTSEVATSEVVASESETPFESLNGDLNGALNGASRNGSGKNGASSNSSTQRARRRRR